VDRATDMIMIYHYRSSPASAHPRSAYRPLRPPGPFRPPDRRAPAHTHTRATGVSPADPPLDRGGPGETREAAAGVAGPLHP
jgi:hypothetical protein